MPLVTKVRIHNDDPGRTLHLCVAPTATIGDLFICVYSDDYRPDKYTAAERDLGYQYVSIPPGMDIIMPLAAPLGKLDPPTV